MRLPCSNSGEKSTGPLLVRYIGSGEFRAVEAGWRSEGKISGTTEGDDDVEDNRSEIG